MNEYKTVMKKYAVFTGRARRREYWMFILVNVIIAFVLGFIGGLAANSSMLGTLYSLAVIVPTIAAGVRRMHDTDHSGWWLLFPVVNFIFAVQDGQRGNNRFGPDPKAVTAAA
jgi:uncharacterized membrane protein YhaH (DUF805 family)